MTFSQWVQWADQQMWGPGMLVLLMGTGIYLTVRTRFLPWRNLGYALRSALGREARVSSGGDGAVSPFSALMTALAATIGTGNIVGVATALTAGGPGALVWMELSAAFGLSSKFAECLLAVKYRQRSARGEWSGGPMYTMRKAISPRWLGRALAFLFALSTVLASFGIGNMTQSHSIAQALNGVFHISPLLTGTVVTALALFAVLGGIRSVSRVSSILVPAMALFYLAAGLAVICGNLSALPGAVVDLFTMALSPKAAAGGAAGSAAAAWFRAVHFGISRGCFSNEAGMGSAAIIASASAAGHPAQQGYISMTGTFFDTMVVCTVTGLCICTSGVLDAADPVTGAPLTGAHLTILAFETVLGRGGAVFVGIAVALFAFSTILGWEYLGEKAFEYLFGVRHLKLYRAVFCLAALPGAVEPLHLVWGLSDLFNAMMAVPNLLSLLLLSDTVAQEALAFQPRVEHRRSKGSRRCRAFGFSADLTRRRSVSPKKRGNFP